MLLMPMMKCLAHYAWLLGRVPCAPLAEQHHMSLLSAALPPCSRGAVGQAGADPLQQRKRRQGKLLWQPGEKKKRREEEGGRGEGGGRTGGRSCKQ